MRVLVYSDVHANLEALEAMAVFASGKYDASICLGDIVGYGANPNEVVAWVRDHAQAVIRGNHDRACANLHGLEWFNDVAADAAHWTHNTLSPGNIAWLNELSQGPMAWRGFTLVHGSPLDEDEYLLGAQQARTSFAETSTPLTFFGHTHVQGGFFVSGAPAQLGTLHTAEANAPAEVVEVEIEIKADTKYLINPGSVGQPRDGDWRAAFVIYDDETRLLAFYRIPYDIASAQARILAAGLPKLLASRLQRGR